METTNENFEVVDQLPALQADPGILHSPDLIIWSDDEHNRVSLPPARIAARIYSNRRRSSAASSRRNSLSSTHSHHSSSSFGNRTTCQSNHVAQHLRRASIIESRKARLADKAAHAEQVRIRAAQAKASTRTSNSEERALAAQHAREKHLAKVAATCAEEVNKAKKRSEEIKERKANEEKRAKLELEEKHAEIGRRRLEYLRTSRKSRMVGIVPADVKKPIPTPCKDVTQETAVLRIQRAWRSTCKRGTVSDFHELHVSVDRIARSDFAEASELLALERIITCTRKVMRLLGLDTGSPNDNDNTAVRTFLSAFMILGHPADIFSQIGQQEQDLADKAKDLVMTFESILSDLSTSASQSLHATLLETLSQAYAAYLIAFAAWKSCDATVLVETMIDQFVALDAIWQTVKDDTRGEVTSDYREGIRDNQVMLLSSIKKLAGPDTANMLIKKAIRDSRRGRSRRTPIGDFRPRPFESSEPSTIANSSEVLQADDTAAILEDQEDTEIPPGLELGELSKIFSVVPHNRILVHELVLDPSFRIEVSSQSDVRSALNREVCESMRRGIEQGQGEVWTVAVAENIRTRLLRLLKPGNSMYQLLAEVLDTDHVRTQCRQGLFSYERFFSFMADLLPRLCAPIRDAEVQVLGQTLKGSGDGADAMIEKLFGLLHMIDVMSLDYTNYMLQEAAPMLIREARGYEQRMFTQDLESNVHSLQHTKRWWRNAALNVHTEASNGDPTGQADFTKIYARGLTDLAVSTTPLRPTEIPETLVLSTTRLTRIRNDMLRFTTVGGILLTAKNLLRRDVRSQWKPEAKRISDSLLKARYSNPDNELTARILAVIESSHGMPPSSRDHLSNVVTRFLAEARCGHLSDPVLKLLFQRLKAHVFGRLAATNSNDRVRVASTASEGLAGIGLSEFIGQIGGVAEELVRLAGWDQAAHGAWYRQVAGEVEEMGEGMGGGVS